MTEVRKCLAGEDGGPAVCRARKGAPGRGGSSTSPLGQAEAGCQGTMRCLRIPGGAKSPKVKGADSAGLWVSETG